MARFVSPREDAVTLTQALCVREFGFDPIEYVPSSVLSEVDVETPFLIEEQQIPIEVANRYLRERAFGKIAIFSSKRLALNSVLAWSRDLCYFLSTYRDPSPILLREGRRVLELYEKHLVAPQTGLSVATIERRFLVAKEFLQYIGAIPSEQLEILDALGTRCRKSAPNLSNQRINLSVVQKRKISRRRHPSTIFLLPPTDLLRFLISFKDPMLGAAAKIMYATGARRAECAGLKAGPIARLQPIYRGGPGKVQVLGKGGKERSIEIENSLIKGLKGLLTSKVRMKRALLFGQKYGVDPYSDDAPLLINRFGDPLSGEAIGDSFIRASERSKIKRTPHELRHEFAVGYLLLAYRKIAESVERSGFDAWLARLMVDRADLVVIRLQHLLGHSSVEVTRNTYLRLLIKSDHGLRDAWCKHLDAFEMDHLA